MESLFLPILIAHLMLTAAMAGLVWFVQLIHYPLFSRVSPESFTAYEREHTRRSGWLIAPLMLAELFTALLLLFFHSGLVILLIINVVLLTLIWLSTFLIQVPLHRRLTQGFQQQSWLKLVQTNWWRTLCWTIRFLLLGYAVVAYYQDPLIRP